MSATAPMGDCLCHLSGGRWGCPLHGGGVGAMQVAQAYGYACGQHPAHDFAIGDEFAVCNRCEKVVRLRQDTT